MLARPLLYPIPPQLAAGCCDIAAFFYAHIDCYSPLGQRLLAASKPKKLALTACMRQLLGILNAILKQRRPWRTPATA